MYNVARHGWCVLKATGRLHSLGFYLKHVSYTELRSVGRKQTLMFLVTLKGTDVFSTKKKKKKEEDMKTKRGVE